MVASDRMRRPNRSAWGFALCVALLVAGCAPTETRLVRVVNPASFPAHPWIGKTETLVLEAWGPNPTRESDGSGGAVLSYRGKAGPVTVTTTDRPAQGPSTLPPSPLGGERIATEPGVTARFWVDAKGLVYRIWFAPSVYKAEKDLPPSAEADEP